MNETMCYDLVTCTATIIYTVIYIFIKIFILLGFYLYALCGLANISPTIL